MSSANAKPFSFSALLEENEKRSEKERSERSSNQLRALETQQDHVLTPASIHTNNDAETDANNGGRTLASQPTVAHQTIVQQSTVVNQVTQPWSETTVAHQTTVDWQAMVRHQDRWTAQPNDVNDVIMRLLDVYEQSVLNRLYRLSWGFGVDTCKVGLDTLASSCNISKKQVQRTIDKLANRGLISRVEYDFGNQSKRERGTIYRINLPQARVARQSTVASQSTVARETTVDSQTTNKETQLKKTHTQREQAVGVGGKSKFTLTECRRYADALRTDGITNPGGYATKIYRSGEADDLVAAFLNPTQNAARLDISRCPDCGGTGFWEPGGVGKGVARCKHERLRETAMEGTAAG